MVVGVLQVELRIPWAQTLKDKRGVLQSIKARLHREHQVSVAEVDQMDVHQVGVLGITLASNSSVYCQSVLGRVLKTLGRERDCVVSGHRIEVLTGEG